MKGKSPSDVCYRCGRKRREAGVLLSHKNGYICDLCVIERNIKALEELDFAPDAGDLAPLDDPALPEDSGKEDSASGEAQNGEEEESEEENEFPALMPFQQADLDKIEQLLSQRSQFQRIDDLDKENIDPEAVTLVPKALAEQFCLIPIRKEGKKLTVAFSDPTDEEAIREVQYFTNLDIYVVSADAFEIEEAIEKYYTSEA